MTHHFFSLLAQTITDAVSYQGFSATLLIAIQMQLTSLQWKVRQLENKLLGKRKRKSMTKES